MLLARVVGVGGVVPGHLADRVVQLRPQVRVVELEGEVDPAVGVVVGLCNHLAVPVEELERELAASKLLVAGLVEGEVDGHLRAPDVAHGRGLDPSCLVGELAFGVDCGVLVLCGYVVLDDFVARAVGKPGEAHAVLAPHLERVLALLVERDIDGAIKAIRAVIELIGAGERPALGIGERDRELEEPVVGAAIVVLHHDELVGCECGVMVSFAFAGARHRTRMMRAQCNRKPRIGRADVIDLVAIPHGKPVQNLIEGGIVRIVQRRVGRRDDIPAMEGDVILARVERGDVVAELLVALVPLLVEDADTERNRTGFDFLVPGVDIGIEIMPDPAVFPFFGHVTLSIAVREVGHRRRVCLDGARRVRCRGLLVVSAGHLDGAGLDDLVGPAFGEADELVLIAIAYVYSVVVVGVRLYRLACG